MVTRRWLIDPKHSCRRLFTRSAPFFTASEVYEPASGIFRPAGDTTAPFIGLFHETLGVVQAHPAVGGFRIRPKATLMANGRVLMTGALNDNGPPTLADPDVFHGRSSASLLVTTVDDSGPGSLREAIVTANTVSGTIDTITFDIAPAGPHTIVPLSPLPTITDPVVIDGTTQPGFAGSPIIELAGMSAGEGANGLRLTGGSSVVRGLVINRFDQSGIRFDIGGGNRVEGNFLGTDVSGTAALGNGLHGLEVRSRGNTIGGATPQARNLVSGNALRGVHISATQVAAACVPATPCIDVSDNVVIGNYVGTDVSGTQPLGNGAAGVLLFQATSVQVGGAGPGEGNVISGNGTRGVAIAGGTASGNVVLGNRIGTDPTGTAAVPNQTLGVRIGGNSSLGGAHDNVIGGAGPGEGNVISGNLGVGVSVGGHSNQVLGNLIGTDVTGTVALGNEFGLSLTSGPNNVVGGAAANVLSGNTVTGVSIVSLFNESDQAFTDASGNTVSGNKIGTDTTGTVAIPNGTVGIYVDGALDEGEGAGPADVPVVGTVISGNIISGNTGIGVNLRSLVSGTQITSNSIGTGSGGVALGNAGDGVFVDLNSSATTGGGVTSGSGNTIATNGGAGIHSDASDTRILGNGIFDNALLGIDLAGDGVTANDVPDVDGIQNFPRLTLAGVTGVVLGSLDSTPSTSFRLEFFTNPACNPSGHGEGAAFLGSAVVATDTTGRAEFDLDLAMPIAEGTAVTATTSGESGGPTSEFSACAQPSTGGIFSGTVTEDGTGTPLAGIQVELFDAAGDFVLQVLTAADGTYVSPPLAAGAYFVLTMGSTTHVDELYDNLPCIGGCDPTEGIQIDITTDTDTSGIDFALAPGGTVSGTVIDAATMAGLLDVNVEYYDETGAFVGGGRTASDGTYTSPVLPGGDYFVHAVVPLEVVPGHVDVLYDDIPCEGGARTRDHRRDMRCAWGPSGHGHRRQRHDRHRLRPPVGTTNVRRHEHRQPRAGLAPSGDAERERQPRLRRHRRVQYPGIRPAHDRAAVGAAPDRRRRLHRRHERAGLGPRLPGRGARRLERQHRRSAARGRPDHRERSRDPQLQQPRDRGAERR